LLRIRITIAWRPTLDRSLPSLSLRSVAVKRGSCVALETKERRVAFFAYMFLPLTVSLGLATIASAVWWQRLESPWAYLGLSVLCMLGVHRAVQFVAEGAKLVFFTQPSGFYIEGSADPVRMLDLAERSFTIEAIVVAAFVVCVGLPILMYLRDALSRR